MNEMPKAYDFQDTEQRIYQWWEQNGWFKPEARPPDAKPFTISIPPPNVTGELHMGHAMFVAVEDLMIRRARMQGRAALWVPGTDHAGIATQLQVEKMLLRTEDVTREEIGREEFLKRTWEWKEKYGSYITMQLRRLGASCDWERERFTLDEGLSRSVREAFVRLLQSQQKVQICGQTISQFRLMLPMRNWQWCLLTTSLIHRSAQTSAITQHMRHPIRRRLMLN
jgi:valyl-tRNA synthetase